MEDASFNFHHEGTGSSSGVCVFVFVCVCVCVCVPTGVKYLLYVTFEMSDAGLCLVHSWYWPNLAKIYT